MFTNSNENFFVRKDYRELFHLSRVMVGGELSGGKIMRFVAPGASHKARLLYGLCSQRLKDLGLESPSGGQGEMFLQKGQKKLVFEQETLQKLWAVKFYVPQFLLATLGRDALGNYLILYQSLIQYREVDEELAACALDALSRHLLLIRLN